jgi:alpha-beta hydrolase superfamily lysophospholipase
MSEQKISFIKGSQGDIAVHDWGHDQPRFLALLVHGYGEHLGRYQYVARTLGAQGARVFGPDHLGHGLSQGERVLIEDYDAVVDDVHRTVEHFKALHPDLPLVVIGHSMGGMIATRYVQRYGDNLRALVLSGPLIGERTQISDLLALPKIPDEPLDTATLSRDPAVGIAYQARWCGMGHSNARRCTLSSRCWAESTPGRASAHCLRCGYTARTTGW